MREILLRFGLAPLPQAHEAAIAVGIGEASIKHNDYAEREIRPTVLAHKVSFGSQSVAGAKMPETWMSVLHSLRKREAHPAEKLVEVLNRKAQEPHLDLAAAIFGLDTG